MCGAPKLQWFLVSCGQIVGTGIAAALPMCVKDIAGSCEILRKSLAEWTRDEVVPKPAKEVRPSVYGLSGLSSWNDRVQPNFRETGFGPLPRC
jgi:hypothetical protein